jgi:two-component system, NtrC family, response regulator HydG
MPTLRIIDGYGRGKAISLTGQTVTIGRDGGNLIQIGDPKASRYHAELVPRPGHEGYLLRDLGSSNGTWTEQGRVEELPLAGGSVFRIGKTYMRFEDDTSEDDEPHTPERTVADDEEGWADPHHIEGLTERSELLARKEMADPRILERANAYLALLHQLVLQSNDVSSRDELFELLDESAADVLDGDRCAVFLPSPGDWQLWPTHERRLRARFGATPFARTLLTEVRRRKEPLLCTSEGDLDPTSSMVQAGVRSAMAAPLRIGDEIHALLYVDRLSGTASFTRVDLEFLAAIANQMAVQLHNRTHVAELVAEVERLQAEPPTRGIDLIGKDPAMVGVESFIRKAGPTPAPVLVLGESGTGKELVARAIHQYSQRADRPLQVVNCAAIAESLVESTLFGHVKGAFTGADETRPGLFELADQGTLFLDEIGELPLGVQAKLLRALEQGEVQRVGDGGTRKVDVRLIAATNRDLREEVDKGSFREDLLHRLDVLSVLLPPLRNRPGDIDLLIDHFLQENAKRLAQPLKKVTPEARALLLRYAWPGNIRQLRNTIERACIMAPDKSITPSDLPEAIRGAETVIMQTPIVPLAEVEKAHILHILEHCGGNKKAAAELLGIDRSTLYAKLRQYGTI